LKVLKKLNNGGLLWAGTVVITPGAEHGGGIGRQMGYFLRSLLSAENARYWPWVRVVHGSSAIAVCQRLQLAYRHTAKPRFSRCRRRGGHM
jgi:hypothetical protein